MSCLLNCLYVTNKLSNDGIYTPQDTRMLQVLLICIRTSWCHTGLLYLLGVAFRWLLHFACYCSASLATVRFARYLAQFALQLGQIPVTSAIIRPDWPTAVQNRCLVLQVTKVSDTLTLQGVPQRPPTDEALQTS